MREPRHNAKPVIRSDHMAEIDGAAQAEYSIPSTVLMENAGIKLYRRLLELHAPETMRGPLVFLSGKGNNGGDALVMARQAVVDGYDDVSVVYLTDELSGDPAVHLAACRALGVPTYRWPGQEAETAVATAGVLVDGLFGTGIRGALRGSGADLVAAANRSEALRVAVDVPSGLGDEFEPSFQVIQADTTLTVELPKRCLYLPAARRHCGRIDVVKIGFPPGLLVPNDDESELVGFVDASQFVPPIPEWTYKTKRGVVAVFGGAPGTTGAAALCAVGCARSRAGLVHLFVEKEVYPILASKLSSVLVHPWSGGAGSLDGFTAIAVGPGWGRTENRLSTLRELSALDIPGVVDADGLNVMADAAADGEPISFRTPWVLTPHPGECARLTGATTGEILTDPVPICRRLATESNAVIVMKSHVTYVVPPQGRVRIVDGMNAALGTGGSGDVLCGVIAALLSGGAPADQAAVAGVIIHAEAGRRCRESDGWFLAEDLPTVVGRIFGELSA